MLLPEFEFHEPTSLDKALDTLLDLSGEAKFLAGGTDLIVNMKNGNINPDHVISLNKVESLSKLQVSDDQIQIGSCVTVAEIAGSQFMGLDLGALKEGAENLGSPAVRNLATIGGNIVSARPAADLPPPLLAYGANLLLKSYSGDRVVKVRDFFRGPGEADIKGDEILIAIVIDRPRLCSGAGYIKLGLRKAVAVSLVNVAAFIALEEGSKYIAKARIALGAVAPVPLRSFSAENILVGEQPSKKLFARAGELAIADCKPISDFRASKGYREEVIPVLIERTLGLAFQRAKSQTQGDKI